jgi:hypothetical protein
MKGRRNGMRTRCTVAGSSAPNAVLTTPGCSALEVTDDVADSWCGGGAVGFHITGLVLALIQTEGWILVAHQGDIGSDAVDPAVDADDQVEEGAGVLAGAQEDEAGDEDQQLEQGDPGGRSSWSIPTRTCLSSRWEHILKPDYDFGSGFEFGLNVILDALTRSLATTAASSS